MVDYNWPELEQARLLGRRLSRIDGPVKSTGHAKYSSDYNLPGMLYAKLLTCPHAHARITGLDVGPARALSGVRAVRVIQDVGAEIKWAHDEIVAVAADTEQLASDALAAIVVEYEILPHFVDEEDLAAAPDTKAPQEETVGDAASAMAAAAATVEARLGMPQIAHMCLEPHGQVAHWQGDELTVYASTQAVSTLPFQFAEVLEVPASKVRIRTDYMGGGFGSKFSPDRWGIECARLARETGRPVKLFLDRDQEVAVGGSRPSSFARIKIGADPSGKLVAWESESWGSGGLPGTSQTPLPYVFDIPNRRRKHTSVSTHLAGARAWRAPNHPQACFMTMAMVEDLAAELELDPLEMLRSNLDLAPEQLQETYRQELDIAADMADWKSAWRPRSEPSEGPVQRGLGLSIHTWGGRGHQSNCEVLVHPDGAVEARIGTQDLGTGTRTVVTAVLAETFGLGLEQVRVNMGDSRFPQSGPSGGSTTVGGVSASTRRAAQNALEALFEKVAGALDAEPTELQARDGWVRVEQEPERRLSWQQACAQMGATAISANGRNPGRGRLIDSGVGGVQIADVSVDTETGIVTVNRMIAVQDCGLVINRKLAESQIHGGLIMGIGTALFEEWIPDPVTGRLLNADMEFYKLAALTDVGQLDVHLMTGPGYDERGVIGLGEPPVISPAAALSNAVANAIGVRVPYLPMTPRRVLDALAGKEVA